MTEVTLSSGNPARPVVIKRLLKKDNSSEWKINGSCFLAACACHEWEPGKQSLLCRSPTQGERRGVGVLCRCAQGHEGGEGDHEGPQRAAGQPVPGEARSLHSCCAMPDLILPPLPAQHMFQGSRGDRGGCACPVAAQFLPQDRVVAFAQLKPGELLRESERAMGDAHLQSLHEQLVSDRKALLDYERVRPRRTMPHVHASCSPALHVAPCLHAQLLGVPA